MTTVCITQPVVETHRPAIRLPRREWMDAAVAAIAFVLLLPGATLLHAIIA